MNIHQQYLVPLWLLAGMAAAQAETVRSTVELDGIENIHLLSPFHLVVTQGEEEYVTIITDSELIDEVEARIKGDTLALGSNGNPFWDSFSATRDRNVTFEVQVKALKYLANRSSGTVQLRPLHSSDDLEFNLQGSGDIRADLLVVDDLAINVRGSGTTRIGRSEVDDLDLTVHGSGNIELDELYARREKLAKAKIVGNGSGGVRIADGEVEDLSIVVNGSGGVDTANLRARKAKVSVNGSGDVEVNVSETLDARINGTGDVGYRGEPTDVDRSVNGSGRVRSRNDSGQ
ncbi:MAG: head GIN domain-containing protein [Cellvibrionaceae bacterium]